MESETTTPSNQPIVPLTKQYTSRNDGKYLVTPRWFYVINGDENLKTFERFARALWNLTVGGVSVDGNRVAWRGTPTIRIACRDWQRHAAGINPNAATRFLVVLHKCGIVLYVPAASVNDGVTKKNDKALVTICKDKLFDDSYMRDFLQALSAALALEAKYANATDQPKRRAKNEEFAEMVELHLQKIRAGRAGRQ